MFQDVTPVLADAELFRASIAALTRAGQLRPPAAPRPSSPGPSCRSGASRTARKKTRSKAEGQRARTIRHLTHAIAVCILIPGIIEKLIRLGHVISVILEAGVIPKAQAIWNQRCASGSKSQLYNINDLLFISRVRQRKADIAIEQRGMTRADSIAWRTVFRRDLIDNDIRHAR